jgi:hypothetical protein
VVDALIDGRFTGLSAVAARLDAAGMPLVGTVAFAAVALVSSGRAATRSRSRRPPTSPPRRSARVVCGTSTTLDDGSALVRTPLILAVAGRATSAADNRADAFAVALEDALRGVDVGAGARRARPGRGHSRARARSRVRARGGNARRGPARDHRPRRCRRGLRGLPPGRGREAWRSVPHPGGRGVARRSPPRRPRGADARSGAGRDPRSGRRPSTC